MNSPNVERLLWEYLRQDGPEAERRKEVWDNVREMREQFQEHLQQDARFHASIEAQQAALVRRVEEIEEAAEVTGVHSVEELRHKYREERAEHREFRKALRTWVWGIAAAVITGAGGYVVRVLIGG